MGGAARSRLEGLVRKECERAHDPDRTGDEVSSAQEFRGAERVVIRVTRSGLPKVERRKS